MSNLDTRSDAIDCSGVHGTQPAAVALSGRESVLGTGLTIHRLLPHREQRMVGPWCFLDLIGPVRFAGDEGVNVAPHPHIGLQTVTWLLQGGLLHKDSLGCEQLIAPGQLNLMTAGRGISHSEESPPQRSPELLGVQFWVALPAQHADIAPAFDHFDTLPTFTRDDAEITVLMGQCQGVVSPAATYWPMIGADIAARRAGSTRIPLEPEFEHALCPMAGEVSLDGERLAPGSLYYLGAGRDHVALQLSADARCMLLGGRAFAEPVLLWWNFVAHDAARIEAARRDWEAHHARFGTVDAYRGARLEAPAFDPNVRLKGA